MPEDKYPWRTFTLIHGTLPASVAECQLFLHLLEAGARLFIARSEVMLLGRIEEVFAQLSSVCLKPEQRQDELLTELLANQSSPLPPGSVVFIKDPLHQATAGLLDQQRPTTVVYVYHGGNTEEDAVATLKLILNVKIFKLVLQPAQEEK